MTLKNRLSQLIEFYTILYYIRTTPVENVFKINFNITKKIRLLAYIIVLDWF